MSSRGIDLPTIRYLETLLRATSPEALRASDASDASCQYVTRLGDAELLITPSSTVRLSADTPNFAAAICNRIARALAAAVRSAAPVASIEALPAV